MHSVVTHGPETPPTGVVDPLVEDPEPEAAYPIPVKEITAKKKTEKISFFIVIVLVKKYML